jgi:hypothetical protein
MRWLTKVFAVLGVCTFVMVVGLAIVIFLMKPSSTDKSADDGVRSSIHTLKAGLTVIPTEISKTKSVELGTLLFALMPIPSAEVDWGWGLNTNVVWIDSGYKDDWNNTFVRRGLARVNVSGEVSTVLKFERHELAWSVTLFSAMPAKFGPQAVIVKAGLKEGLICFGTLYTGCEFDILPSLRLAKIDAHRVCDVQATGLKVDVYSISAKGKRPAVLVLNTGFGSGGAQSTVTLWFDMNAQSVCDAENARR